MDNSSLLGSPSESTHGGVSQVNGAGPRRPQTLMTPVDRKLVSPPQTLTLTIHKDSGGYGMKVSGDNPVYVESVKPGGAAQKAGLVEGDMILKVNGNNVRLATHTYVVQLIKSSATVELTVQRNYKMQQQRPSSVSVGPSTPLAQRGGITAPKPVDMATSLELKMRKIETLSTYLEKEKKNLDYLRSNNRHDNNARDISKCEHTIKTVQQQLQMQCGEAPPMHSTTFSHIPQSDSVPVFQPTVVAAPSPAPPSTPAFLSRFPRSLSSLSLVSKKKPADKEVSTAAVTATPSSAASTPISSPNTSFQSPGDPSNAMHQPHPFMHHHHPHHQHQQQPATTVQQRNSNFNVVDVKKKFGVYGASVENNDDDVPPPLPQRNMPRKASDGGCGGGGGGGMDMFGSDVNLRRSHQISDLDHSQSTVALTSPMAAANNNVGLLSPAKTPDKTGGGSSGKGKSSRSKSQKIKALSDPKVSSQMFIEMEQSLGGGDKAPPPLPPRQPGMLEEKQNVMNNNKFGGACSPGITNYGNRPSPNSIDTLMNYPLTTTTQAVRDNFAAFPLSHRPNVQQILQQQQHQQSYNSQHNSSTVTSAATTTTTVLSKSTALGLTPQQLNKINNAQHRRAVSSPAHYPMPETSEHVQEERQKSASGSWELLEKDNESAPPLDGTPPPRYSPTQQLDDSLGGDSIFDTTFPMNVSITSSQLAKVASSGGTAGGAMASSSSSQHQIISMEDDEISEDQDPISEDHGPFRSLHQLLEHENIAYLSVFLNFVLSNSNPSPLLFYLITGLYKDGTVKDMRKWAYEIHSTFLVPRAPLLWCAVHESEALARDVDNVLQNEYHKGEILRVIFRKSRQRAKEHITQQIDDFKMKRTAGLSTMYGPGDAQLFEAKGDKAREQRVFEDTLMPKMQQLVDELEREAPHECPKKSALSSALSTVLHRIFVTRSNPGSPIDRVHHFVSREKSFKSRLMGKTRKAMVRGHHLVLRQYYEVAHCNHCQNIIWGVSPQGYHCTDCELNIHRSCSKVLEENCPGPAPTKQKGQHTDKMSKFIEKIRPAQYFVQQERQRRLDEECVSEELSPPDRPTSASVTRQPSDRRPETANINASSHTQNASELAHTQSIEVDPNAPDAETDQRDSSKSKSAPVSVNRSESYKERLSHRRNRNNRRKTSDPSLSKTNDEPVELGISNANFTNSSSSSLSSSLDSPSTSLEAVGAPTAGQGTVPAPRQWVDSEDEAGDLEADWSSNVAADTLQTLSKHEKERQEIINEIYQTERNHVRTLKLLVGIFQRPLQESGALNSEHLTLLFPPALLNLKDHHSLFEQQLKQRRIEHGSVVTAIGDLLLAMFDGRSGEDLKDHAAHFCARQQIALEALKEKRRKDEGLQRLLTKAESHKACRRLQLKDLLPTALQRLTKYPLLFESLYAITLKVEPDNEIEALAIRKALELSKRILDHVNQAVRIAEDAHKLQTIQKKLDKTSYDKEAANEFKNLDLTQHKLLHDGLLISKKNPGLQIHALLFENIMVLLQKLDDKYILKSHTCPYTGSGDGGKGVEGKFNPVSKINLILVRNLAVDKNTFFLINTSSSQMMELTAPSSSECKTWVKHISDAADAFKSRTKGHHEQVEDSVAVAAASAAAAAAAAAVSNPSSKESLDEQTPEKELAAAGAVALGNNNNSVDISDDPLIVEPNNNRDAIAKRHLTKGNGENNDYGTDDDEDEAATEQSGVAAAAAEGTRVDDSHQRHHHHNDDDDDSVTVRKREYSNNSNNTRTLTQQSSLVPPSEVQISVSPAMTAEPVLTPNEQLRRLDESIRLTLAEKQKVVCDMFRVPNEHFMAIADIVGQPEAPKDPSDIVLAAFAQVQSLTETLNEYIRVSQHQEISAVSTSLCDECHHNNQNMPRTSRLSYPPCVVSSSETVIVTDNINPLTGSTPPLITTASTSFATVVKNNVIAEPIVVIDDVLVDDDGYCEIDELRLPTVLVSAAAISSSALSTVGTAVGVAAATANHTPPELKRQSTISADSIPEETEHEIHAELTSTTIDGVGEFVAPSTDDGNDRFDDHIDIDDTGDDDKSREIAAPECFVSDGDTKHSHLLHHHNHSALHCVDIMNGCGVNRLAHATSLAPAIPCHLISNYVTALSLQISLLLPKLHERDIEREKLRKENQHLRELLNSMHDRERVSNEKDTTRHASEPRPASSHQIDSTD